MSISKIKKIAMKIKHVPVMYEEVLKNLPQNLELFMDGTVWHAWHSRLVKEKFDNVNIIAVDKDVNMLKVAKENLQDKDINYIHNSYKNLEDILKDKKVDAILLDLWVNMEHLKDAKRWFSIKYDGPLDMRFDINQKITAEFILKNYTEDKLAGILEAYWDFRWTYLQNIVRSIIKSRSKLKSTKDLVDVLKQTWLSSKKIAVVFQVLRIEVNNELEQLERFLEKFPSYLRNNGRCLIITFHSIEDRLVKNRFKELDKNWFKNITKKVIFPSLTEITANKAAKSAKLRIIEKI